MFIAIDGIEGCGKSTQAELLAKKLNGHLVQDPGTTDIGKQIRTILLSPSNKEMEVRTELMLFMASRAQMMAQIIKPYLESGVTVISDRFVSSTIAYQHAIDAAAIMRVAEYALGGIFPDMTYILDLPVEAMRVQPKFGETKVLDRFEQKPKAFHENVRNRYRNLEPQWPDRYKTFSVLDRNIQQVHNMILGDIERRFSL